MHYKYICRHCSKRFELGQAYSNHIKSHNSSLNSEDSDESIEIDNELIEIDDDSTSQYCKQQLEPKLFKSCSSSFNKDSDTDGIDDYPISQYYEQKFESELFKLETDEDLNAEETIHQKMVCNYCFLIF
jgi:hypothetical protein